MMVVLTRSGSVYTWGSNAFGQLGLGDNNDRSTPHRIDALEGKRVTSFACGKEFVIALGLTIPVKDLASYNAMSKKKNKGKRDDSIRSESKGRKQQKSHIKKEYDTLS